MKKNKLLKIIEQNENISEKDIKKFERKNKLTLPEDYKDFLLKYNGGYPEEHIYKYRGQNNKYKVRSFILMEFFSLDSIPLFWQDYWENLIEIAIEYGGHGHLLLSISGDDRGSLYYYYDGDLNYYLVANSFSELMSNFTIID